MKDYLGILMGWGQGKNGVMTVSLNFVSPPRGAGQQIQSRLIECPPPRKSLVKGERFIRSEGRPEWNELEREGWWLISHRGGSTLVGRRKRM